MSEDYYAERTNRRTAFVRRVIWIALLIAAGSYILTSDWPSADETVAWASGLALWLLKCLLIAYSIVALTVTVNIWRHTLLLVGIGALKNAPTMLRLGLYSTNRQGWRTFLCCICLPA